MLWFNESNLTNKKNVFKCSDMQMCQYYHHFKSNSKMRKWFFEGFLVKSCVTVNKKDPVNDSFLQIDNEWKINTREYSGNLQIQKLIVRKISTVFIFLALLGWRTSFDKCCQLYIQEITETRDDMGYLRD